MLRTLGLDLGLSGARAAVVDEKGDLLGRGRVPHRARPGFDDAAERDPAQWFEEVVAAGRAALADAGPGGIDAIGLGALGPCPVLLDEGLQPLAPSPLFVFDRRSEPYRRRLIEAGRAEAATLRSDHALPKLLRWQAEAPSMFARAAHVVDATGFLAARLAGRAVMDPITACDYRLEGFAPPLPLPALLPAEAIAGGLLPEAAGLLGLPAGTPVTVGTYDSYVDIGGTGSREPGDACVILGTTLILGAVIAGPRDLPGLCRTPHLGPGWFLGGWTSAAGSLLEWCMALLAGHAPDEIQRRAAALAPGAGGLLVLPHFAGERAPIWDSAARGLVLGATLDTTGPELYRAAIDGVALSALELTSRLDQAGLGGGRWRIAGGGLRNPIWAQAVCDCLDRPLEAVAFPGEAVAPALLALRALGRAAAPQIATVLQPDPSRRGRYRELHQVYRGLYPALAGSMHELGRISAQQEMT
jgi:xylulokinase